MVLGVRSGGVQLTLFENNTKVNRFTNQATNRLATGLRINSGKDDPAGLVGAAKLQGDLVEIDAQIKTTSARQRQLSVEQSGRQTASNTLIELRGLLVQAASGATTDEERAAIQLEIDASLDALDTLGATTGYEASDTLNSLRSGGDASVIDGDVEAAIELVQAEQSAVNLASAEAGAYEKYTLEVDQELAAARKIATASALSQLQDTNFAEETSNLIKGKILTDASIRTMALYNKIKSDQISSLFDRLG